MLEKLRMFRASLLADPLRGSLIASLLLLFSGIIVRLLFNPIAFLAHPLKELSQMLVVVVIFAIIVYVYAARTNRNL